MQSSYQNSGGWFYTSVQNFRVEARDIIEDPSRVFFFSVSDKDPRPVVSSNTPSKTVQVHYTNARCYSSIDIPHPFVQQTIMSSSRRGILAVLFSSSEFG